MTLKEMMMPGVEIHKHLKGYEIRGTGTALGVFYIDEYVIVENEPDPVSGELKEVHRVVIPSNEREALRYLRPASEQFYLRHPRQGGYCMPDATGLIPKELLKVAQAKECRVRWLFTDGLRCTVELNQDQYFKYWTTHKINNELWIAEYVEGIE
jgi:hypothetical protein